MKKHTYLRLFCLVSGLAGMALAQFSFFSESKFVFSSHMAGHVILLLIAAPFFVLAMRERPEAKGGLAFRISRRLSAMPWLNWIIGVGVLWVWQVPTVFNALLAWDGPGFHRHLHILSFLHSGSLLLAGILILWIPSCFLYLGGSIYLLREWMGKELWTQHDFYGHSRKRRVKAAQDQLPAESDGYAARGGAVIPQLGIPDPLDHLA